LVTRRPDASEPAGLFVSPFRFEAARTALIFVMRLNFWRIGFAALVTTTALAIEPPENLVVDHVPVIPDELVRKASPYLEARTASFWDWHPIRREVLIGTRFAETMQAHQVAFPGGARRQLTFQNEPVFRATFKPKTAEYMVFQQDSGGGEFYQLYRIDPHSPAPTLLTDGKSRNEMGPWSKPGDLLAYTSTKRNGRDSDIYAMNPADPASARMLLQVNGGGWSALDWSPDDTKLLLLHYVSINESYLYLLDAKSGTPQMLTPKLGNGQKVSYANAKFSKDGNQIYFTSDLNSEFMRLTRADLGPVGLGTLVALSAHINWDITDYDLSSDGKTIAMVSNEDGVSVLRFLDTKTGKEKLKPQLPAAGVITGLKWHEKEPEVAFSFSSAQSPSDVYSVSTKGKREGKVERWTESETGGLDALKFVSPEMVKLNSPDGVPVSAFAYYPEANRFPGKRAALILIHGGPESQSLPTFQGRYNYLINELGIALIVPNVRGSAGYGKTYLTLDNATKREDSVNDIGTVIRWIQRNGRLDGDRIAVMGGSYGGYMTLASMVNFSDQLRCGIDIVGISNFITFLENTQEYRRDLRRAEYGDERVPEIREYLEKIAPAKNVAKIKRPMLIVQGKNDPRVPLSESEQMVSALRDAKVETWYLMAKDEGHGFRKKRNIDYQFYATIEFLRKNLLTD
jgi:dipeptidyl aminopeptidase/acylaminoacyl peptidase